MMLKRRWTYGACFAGVLLMGMSAAPRYLEELRIGGGSACAAWRQQWRGVRR